jgi:hypothetical protein
MRIEREDLIDAFKSSIRDLDDAIDRAEMGFYPKYKADLDKIKSLENKRAFIKRILEALDF